MTTMTSPLTTASTLPPATFVPQNYASLPAPVVNPGVNTQPTFVGLGTPLSYVPPSVDAKSLSLSGVVTAPCVSLPQPSTGQTSGTAQPITASVTPTIIVRQPEAVRPYSGTTSYRAYREYFERICQCNSWTSETECARHLLVAMEGAASEAVRGLKAEKDSDLKQIWDALHRRFGYVDEPDRAMRRFDVCKQQEGQSLAVFEQGLRALYREAWPKTDIGSPEADSLLRRRFVDGVSDVELQKYLRLHAASDDFAATVSKARHFVDANELSRVPKKPALRTTSPSVNYQSIIDGVREVVESALHDRGRQAQVNALQVPVSSTNLGPPGRKTPPRQGSPAPSDASSGASSRATSGNRTVRFQVPRDDRSRQQTYGASGRRWQDNQSFRQGNGNGPRPWSDRQPGG